MTAFRMRHAGGLEEMLAQIGRHFLRPTQQEVPVQPGGQQAGLQAGQQSQQKQQGAEQAAGLAASEALGATDARGRLSRLAAAQGELSAVFAAAAAAGGDPVAAVHAAAAAAAEPAVPRVEPAGATPPLPPPTASEQQLQEEELGVREFAAFTYLSQLQQALAYQAAIHRWRRAKTDPGALVRLLRAGSALPTATPTPLVGASWLDSAHLSPLSSPLPTQLCTAATPPLPRRWACCTGS